jgi:hypothetical protein
MNRYLQFLEKITSSPAIMDAYIDCSIGGMRKMTTGAGTKKKTAIEEQRKRETK